MRNQEMWTFLNLKLGVKKMWQGNRLLIKQLRRNPMHPANQTAWEVQQLKGQNGHTIYACHQPQCITWRQSSRSSGGSTDDNMTTLWVIWIWIWLFGTFLNTALQAAVHLGQDHDANLHYVKNHLWNSAGLIPWNWKLISEQQEITGVYALQISKMQRGCRQAYCVKRLTGSPTPKCTSSPTLCSVWKKCEMILLRLRRAKLNGIRKTITSKIRIDGMPTEFEWKIFPGTMALGLLEKIQNLMRDLQCKLEDFTDRIIFMSMYSDIEWRVTGNKERCEHNSQTVADYARRFPRGHWSFLGPG